MGPSGPTENRRRGEAMFERFTERARRVVVMAREEARLLDHDYIGTEHVLLGLLHADDGVAARALDDLGVRLEAARFEIREIVGEGEGEGDRSPSGHIPFTPRAKKALELSLREALRLGHDYIGTEHILLGLIREGDGVGARVLVKRGLTEATVRGRVLGLLPEPGDPHLTGAAIDSPRSLGPLGPGPLPGWPALLHGPPLAAGMTPGGLAAIFVLVGILASVVERPPSTTDRWSLALSLVGLVAAAGSAVIPRLPRRLIGPDRRRQRLAAATLGVSLTALGAAALVATIGALLA